MQRTSYLVLAFILTIATNPACRVQADDTRCCAGCGCAVPCQKVCRLECSEKQVEVVCWGCKCEDFCIPGKSEKLATHCETVCEDCGADSDSKVCSKPKKFVWRDWCPGCGEVHTKTKLMKKIETVTVPSYKWVVEDMCPQCAANAAAAQPGAIVYAAPASTETTPSATVEEESIFNIVRLPKLMSK